MSRLFSIILLIFLCSPIQFGQALTKEEYSAFASILKIIFKENQQTYIHSAEFVIFDTTKLCDSDVYTTTKIQGLENDFSEKNRSPATMERRFPINQKYFLISKEELNELFSAGRLEQEKHRLESGYTELGAEHWFPFFRKYSESTGYYTFSRAGFSSNRKFAMVCVNHHSNLLGFSRFYILRKTNKRWRIVHFGGAEYV